MPSAILITKRAQKDPGDGIAVLSAILSTKGAQMDPGIVEECPRWIWPPKGHKQTKKLLQKCPERFRPLRGHRRILEMPQMDYRDAKTVPSADRPPKAHNWTKEKCLVGSAGRREWEDPEYVIEVSSAILVDKVTQLDCGEL